MRYQMRRFVILLIVTSFAAFSCSEEAVEITVPTEVAPYELFGEVKELNTRQFLDEVAKGAEFNDDQKEVILDMLSLVLNLKKEISIRTYDISYPSKDLTGQDIRLSARVYVPCSVKSGDILPGVVLGNHHYITAAKYSPTNICVIEALPVFFGYAVVVPDNMGLGISRDMPQLFANSNHNGMTGVQALSAGLKMLEDIGIGYEKNRLYNVGYSFGAQSAIGGLKYTSCHPDCGVRFYKTFAGSGSYDPLLTMDGYSSGDYPYGEAFEIVALASLIEECAGDLNPADVFKEPLLSTYRELILSKNHSIFEVRDALGTGGLSAYIHDGVLTKTSDAWRKIESISLSNRALGGWDMADGTELYLFGCKDDDYIPYTQYENAKYFIEHSFPKINLHCFSVMTGGHVHGSAVFAKWVADNWE